MKRNSKNDPVKTYTMMTFAYDGATPDARFTFNAKDDKDADSKAFGWARYHGYTTKMWTVREATAEELNWTLRNEYVS